MRQMPEMITMEPDRTCKRCSVARVNNLCHAYERAHGPEGERMLKALRRVVDMVKERGFEGGAVLLMAGLNEKDLRAQCWNISSFLKDEEVEAVLGLN